MNKENLEKVRILKLDEAGVDFDNSIFVVAMTGEYMRTLEIMLQYCSLRNFCIENRRIFGLIYNKLGEIIYESEEMFDSYETEDYNYGIDMKREIL